jgi:hypothetical protein
VADDTSGESPVARPVLFTYKKPKCSLSPESEEESRTAVNYPEFGRKVARLLSPPSITPHRVVSPPGGASYEHGLLDLALTEEVLKTKQMMQEFRDQRSLEVFVHDEERWKETSYARSLSSEPD